MLSSFYASLVMTESSNPLPSLSDRQMQVLQCICDGLSSKQMAERLGLSIKTIEMHRSRLHARLGTRNAQQVIRRVNGPLKIRLFHGASPTDTYNHGLAG